MADEDPKPKTDGRRSESASVRILVDVILFVALGIFSIELSWFGFDALVARHTNNLLTQLVATRYGSVSDFPAPPELVLPERYEPDRSRVRERPAQRMTSVVTITDDDLELFGERAWPATYGFHAKLISEIAAMKPALLFIDVVFADARDEDWSLEALQYVLDEIDPEGDGGRSTVAVADGEKATRLMLAGSPSFCDGGVTEALAGDDHGRVVLAPREIDTEDLHDRIYRLQPGSGNQGCLRRSAALVAYDHFNDTVARRVHERGDFDENLYALWGTRSSRANWALRGCRQEETLVGGLFDRLNGAPSDFKSDCPYHATMSASQVMKPELRDLVRPLIEGRYVFYSYDSPLSYDQITTPTHLRLAGVHMHAMAFDNLVTYGAGYARDPDAMGAENRLVAFALLLVIGVIRAFHGNDAAGGIVSRISPWRWPWLLLVTAMTVAALVLAVFMLLQLLWDVGAGSPPSWGLVIGLVPVVMTIGIGIVYWLRWLDERRSGVTDAQEIGAAHIVLTAFVLLLVATIACGLAWFRIAPFGLVGVVGMLAGSRSWAYSDVEDRIGSFVERRLGSIESPANPQGETP